MAIDPLAVETSSVGTGMIWDAVLVGLGLECRRVESRLLKASEANSEMALLPSVVFARGVATCVGYDRPMLTPIDILTVASSDGCG